MRQTAAALVCREETSAPYAAPAPLAAAGGAIRSSRSACRASLEAASTVSYAGRRSPAQADALAMSLRTGLEQICLPLARAAAAFVHDKTWLAFGFARLEDHARERFGRSGRWVRDFASLGEALERFPALATALTGDDGARPLGRVAALLVARAAAPASIETWITRARAMTVRELRSAVKEARGSSSPWPPGCESPSPPPEAGVLPPGQEADGPAPAGGETARTSISSCAEDDLTERSLLRIPIPAPLLAAFDEAVDLYRAVEGAEASVTSFVEALVAESIAFDWPPDAHDVSRSEGERPEEFNRVALRRGADVAAAEGALARSTSNWRCLPPALPGSRVLDSGGSRLSRLDVLSPATGSGTPADLDARIRALITLENSLEGRLGRVLAAMAEGGVWSRLRFAGVGHYAEERLGLSRTSAEDRARAARALRGFPLLRAAYEDGRIGLEAILLVLRILGPGPVDRATEAAWLRRAEEATVKRLRDEARALGRRRFADRPGLMDEGGCVDPAGRSLPADATICDAIRLRGRSWTTLAPGMRVPRAPQPFDDAGWHASLRREPGVACRRVLRYGRLAAVWSDEAGSLPIPDVFLRLRLPDDLADGLSAVIESARRSIGARVQACPWGDPWSGSDTLPSTLAARAFSNRARPVPAWVGFLALLEDFVLTWDGAARPSDGPGAAAGRRSLRQSCGNDAPGDPPLRDPEPGHEGPRLTGARQTPRRHGDAVYIRDGWRCSAPACTSRRNLEDHHIIYRSRQGCDDLANRICLCRFHHQQGEHGLRASCRGTAPLGVSWRLGRRELGVLYRNERRGFRVTAAPAGCGNAGSRGSWREP